MTVEELDPMPTVDFALLVDRTDVVGASDGGTCRVIELSCLGAEAVCRAVIPVCRPVDEEMDREALLVINQQCEPCIGGMGAVWRERAGAEGERRAADGSHEGCGPGWWRHGAAPWSTRRPSGLPRGRQQGRGRHWQRDGSRLNTTRAGVAPAPQPAQAGRVGSDRCSRMARTALGAVRYANTRRLPPQLVFSWAHVRRKFLEAEREGPA